MHPWKFFVHVFFFEYGHTNNILNLHAHEMRVECFILLPLLYNSGDIDFSAIYIKEPMTIYPEYVGYCRWLCNDYQWPYYGFYVVFNLEDIIEFTLLQVIENVENYKFFGGFALPVPLTVTGKYGDGTFEVEGEVMIFSAVRAIPT